MDAARYNLNNESLDYRSQLSAGTAIVTTTTAKGSAEAKRGGAPANMRLGKCGFIGVPVAVESLLTNILQCS
jgi:hypothetical protein